MQTQTTANGNGKGKSPQKDSAGKLRKQQEIPGAERPRNEDLDALILAEDEHDQEVAKATAARTEKRKAIDAYLEEHKIAVYTAVDGERKITWKHGTKTTSSKSVADADKES